MTNSSIGEFVQRYITISLTNGTCKEGQKRVFASMQTYIYPPEIDLQCLLRHVLLFFPLARMFVLPILVRLWHSQHGVDGKSQHKACFFIWREQVI